MVIVKEKAVGEEGLQTLLRLIATRASVDEAILKRNIGDGLAVDPNTEKVNVEYATDKDIEDTIAGLDSLFSNSGG